MAEILGQLDDIEMMTSDVKTPDATTPHMQIMKKPSLIERLRPKFRKSLLATAENLSVSSPVSKKRQAQKG